MKIIKSNLSGLLLLAISFFAVSCDKEIERSNLTLDNNETADIVVYAYADVDKTTHGLEKVPNGTQAFIKIANDQYNPSATGVTVQIVEVSNGKIEATIKTTKDGVDIDVLIPDFVAKQKQAYGSESATLSYLFEGKKSLAKVLPGEERVAELFCTSTKMSSEVEFVTRKFKINAVLNVDDGTKEVVGATVNFYTLGWSGQGTTDGEGEISIAVPKNEWISAEFTANKKWDTIESGKKLYRYRRVDFGIYSESHPVAESVNFFGGELFE